MAEVVAAVVLSLWLGWLRNAARIREESDKLLKSEIAAAREKAKKSFSALAGTSNKLAIKSKHQVAALERYGVKADADPYRIMPRTSEAKPN